MCHPVSPGVTRCRLPPQTAADGTHVQEPGAISFASDETPGLEHSLVLKGLV